MKTILFALLLGATTAIAAQAAEEKLPNPAAQQPEIRTRTAAIFRDHMVLQRDMPVPVWGWAKPGEEVTVEFAGQKKSARADTAGKWLVKLEPLAVSAEPKELKVGAMVIRDVLVGEVWLASGQSNMDFPIRWDSKAHEAIPNCQDADLRLFFTPNGKWMTCEPSTLAGQYGWNKLGFSAVAYFFGKHLRENLKCPVGLIQSTAGGTPVEQWSTGGNCFKQLVEPLIPYAMRGVIWYQGEANGSELKRAKDYARLFPAMITSWRTQWGQGDFPFLYVQLAAFGGHPEWYFPQLRESQQKTLALPNTGMATAIDLGNPLDDIHPACKSEVGKRLALLARRIAYGEPVVSTGPVFNSINIKDGTLRLSFTGIGGGLVTGEPVWTYDGKPIPHSDKVLGFEIAGADGRYLPVEGIIDGNEVVLSSRDVPQPVAARYCWAMFPSPQGNLYNKEGLPAFPFRTDTTGDMSVATLPQNAKLTPESLPIKQGAQFASGELLRMTVPGPLTPTVTAEGSIDLSTAAGHTLKNCRPYLASRAVGSDAWSEEYSTYSIVSQNDSVFVLEAVFAQSKATVTINRDAAGRLQFSGKLDATGSDALELARFHYLDGLLPTPETNLLSMRHYELPGRIIRPTQKVRAPLKSNWGWVRLNDPIHSRENIAISGDSGMLGSNWNTSGFFFGFTGPGSAFGELGMRTAIPEPTFFLAVLLDAIRLDPGKSRVLETATISYGDSQQELRHWIGLCRDTLGPARVRPPLVGYCSWYQLKHGVQPEHIRRALKGFASFDNPPGGQTIQIDDGFQVMPGDWSGRGKWKHELDQLPQEIRAKGFIPGIWIAPTAIHKSHPIVKEHPEWLQRDAKGDLCITFYNWRHFNGMTDGNTYFLDPDHPGARAFILKTLRDLRAKGWDYFKIDFAYTVSSNRAKYDPFKTTYETLRDQWRLFREGLGEDALINSCNGGIWRYTIGSVDISRIGGDIGGNVKQLKYNLGEMMLRAQVNGVWFQIDPDVFYMRREDSDLNFEQSHILTGTQGLLGSAMLTSDFADQWDAAATSVVKRYWNKTGPVVPASQHLFLRDDGIPLAVSAAYGPSDYAVGIYNWATTPKDMTVSLNDLRLPTADYQISHADQGQEKIGIADGAVTIKAQPGESLRIVLLSRRQ